MNLKKLFGDKRIVALVGEKSSGKTNNLMSAVKEFRQKNDSTEILFFGLDSRTSDWISRFPNTHEFSELEHLNGKENCIIIIDEMQLLGLNDKRQKERRDAFADFIYHDNNYAIISSCNTREFNSVIGAIVERWAVKVVRSSSLVNGSQIKDRVARYRGRYKKIDGIFTPKDTMVVLNDEIETVLTFDYINEIDGKKENIDVFASDKKVKKKSEKSP